MREVDVPFFSIVIASYNSERTIGYTFESIEKQTIDKRLIEVIVVDGGSQDKTKEIAEKVGAKIIENPLRLPEYAKAIGMREAKGRFVLRMDSDEEFTYECQLEDKMQLLIEHPEVKMMISDKIIPGRKELTGISANYMNILGDPFSYFVYKTKKTKTETYAKNIVIKEGKNNILVFKKGDVYPLADSATSLASMEYIREKYREVYDSVDFVCSTYDHIIEDTHICGIVSGDFISHNCSSDFRTYLAKLKFRVINNIFYKKESGFSNKEIYSRSLKKRKVLFVLYSLMVPLVLLDSVRLAVVYRDVTFILHFVYVYYVCFMILCVLILKCSSIELKNVSYGR